MTRSKFEPDMDMEWNQNIVRNLRYKFGDSLKDVSDSDLVIRHMEWTAEFCLSEEDEGFMEYLQTGE